MSKDGIWKRPKIPSVATRNAAISAHTAAALEEVSAIGGSALAELRDEIRSLEPA